MHDPQSEFNQIDWEAGADPELRGAECSSCFRLLKWQFFPKNSAYKTGYYPQCYECLKAPRLSINEHVARLREENFNSEGTRRQRHEDQSEFRKDRRGRTMDCSLFLQKLLHVCPSLYVTQGGIKGDLALYVTGPECREWGNRGFKYLGYVTLGTLPEYSSYEFDEARDVMVRVKDIGWRSVLLRFIENNILTEKQCDKEFGPASGGANSTWFKNLHKIRNRKNL